MEKRKTSGTFPNFVHWGKKGVWEFWDKD